MITLSFRVDIFEIGNAKMKITFSREIEMSNYYFVIDLIVKK